MSSPAEQKPYHLRLPHIDQEDLMQTMRTHPGLKDLDAWYQVMQHPLRHGENLFMLSVPDLFAAECAYYNKVLGLISGIDTSLPDNEIMEQTVKFKESIGANHARLFLMLCWLLCEHTPNEFAKVVTTGMAGANAGVTPTKLLVLDHPDSDVWTDDERLALRFAKAAFNYEMTDELCEAAVEAWGVQWIMSTMSLLCFYQGYALRYEMAGLDRVAGLRADVSVAEQLGW